jgi:hypothetical protein
MPKNSLLRIAGQVIRNNNVADSSGSQTTSTNWGLIAQRSSDMRARFEEPFESVIHIDIPRPPPELENAPAKIPSVLSPRLSRHAQRKYAAARRWNTEVLPALIEPFMAYEKKAKSNLSSSDNGGEHYLCNCTQKHVLFIICVYLDREFVSRYLSSRHLIRVRRNRGPHTRGVPMPYCSSPSCQTWTFPMCTSAPHTRCQS